MVQLIELVIVAFLALIVVELLLIYREIARGQLYHKLPKEDSNATGQTINVTVGAPQGSQPSVVVAKDAITHHEEQPVVQSPDDKVNLELDNKKPATSIPARTTTSGLVVKKCASCGAENSSYRTECFNCGAAL